MTVRRKKFAQQPTACCTLFDIRDLFCIQLSCWYQSRLVRVTGLHNELAKVERRHIDLIVIRRLGKPVHQGLVGHQ